MTTYSYDALGRTATEGTTPAIRRPDGSTVGVTFSTTSSTYCATTTDEQGNARTTCNDALGRLKNVAEDPSGKNYQTAYTYDALNDLLSVNQGGLNRWFTYDSLSRLVTASNPESGLASYTYDANGNMSSRTRPAPNQPSASNTVTTGYNYDVLNRPIKRTYSDGVTPEVDSVYDQPGVSIGATQYTVNNPVGRLTYTSIANSAMNMYSYDPMGRVANYWACIQPYFSCAPTSGSLGSFNYQYNLAGDATQWGTAGIGSAFTSHADVTITNGVDNFERITSVASNLSDSTHPGTLATIATYSPFGAPTQVNDGCIGGNCVQEVYTFNSRLQPGLIEVGSASNPTANYCLAPYYYSSSSPTSCANFQTGSSGNNGNVMGEYLQEGATGAGFPALQHQTINHYDGLNRLLDSQATAISPGTVSYPKMTFNYDQYGNMGCAASGVTGCPYLTFSSRNPNNRVNGYTYDAAGNVLSDGTYSYAWDPEGKLLYVSGATPSGNFWATYGYDPSGQRVTATVTTQGVSVGYAYVNDASGKEYAEINTTQSKVDYNNFWLGDRIFAKYDQANGTVFLHPNNVGSTAMTTGPTNSPIGTEVFYPWGQSWASAGTLEEERFAKLHQRDIGTGLDYTLNRMYPSWQGRWLTPDPAGRNVVKLDDPQT
ncbi:MAG: hypothetical protein ACLQOO_23340 [Terriglobia bacterium]